MDGEFVQEEFNREDFDVQKIISYSNENTEWKKSTPLKTYSKKTTPPSSDKTDGKSRYGRSHKPRLSMDFLSTDKKVSQYLKIDSDNQMHYFKSQPYTVQKTPIKTIPGTPRGRGRPPKSATSLPNPPKVDGKFQALNEAFDKVIALTPGSSLSELQAPLPTSTETVEVPMLSYQQEDQLSDVEEVINENDWNVGDLAWACVGGYPYWPCAVTKDPEGNIFRKMKAHGKSKQLREYIHVRFFGDKGRRSWIVANNVIPFHGLDSFQSLAEETCTTPLIRKKDPKTFKAFTILPSVRKTWQAAVSEAESLREAPRQERVQYFHNMFPPTPPAMMHQLPLEKPTPKKRGRKSKAELAAMAAAAGLVASPEPAAKKMKLEPQENPSFLASTPSAPYVPSLNISTAGLGSFSSGPPVTYPASRKKVEKRGRPRLSISFPKKPVDVAQRRCRTPSPTMSSKSSNKEEEDPWANSSQKPYGYYKSSLPPLNLEALAGSPPSTSTPAGTPAETPVKTPAATPVKTPAPTPEGTPTATLGEVPKKKRGRPLGSTKKKKPPNDDADFVPKGKRNLEKKTLNESKPKENKTRRNSDASKKKNGDKKFHDPAYELYYEKNFDRVSDENPNLSKADIEKFIEKMWREVKEQKTSSFRARDNPETISVDSGNDSKSETSSRSDSPPPITLPSSKTPYRRGISLFSGVKNEKVCQVCLKNGDVIKCKGPCGLSFHLECADKPRFDVNIKNEPKEEVIVKRKKGRPPKNVPPESKTVVNGSETATSAQSLQHQANFNPFLPSTSTTSPPLNPDGSPTKRKRGRPRKTPLLVPTTPSNSFAIKEEPVNAYRLPDERLLPFLTYDIKTTLNDEIDFLGFDVMPADVKERITKVINIYKAINTGSIIDEKPSSIKLSDVSTTCGDSGVSCNENMTSIPEKGYTNEIIELPNIPNGLPVDIDKIKKEISNPGITGGTIDGPAEITLVNTKPVSNSTEITSCSLKNDKLLDTLQGVSFVSETTNNNVVVLDDSSTDDRLMIEESPQQNETCETESAVLSITNPGESLTYDNFNSQSFETETNMQNKETDSNLRKISLDMPTLDFSESEETMPPNVINEKPKTENLTESLQSFTPINKLPVDSINFELPTESVPLEFKKEDISIKKEDISFSEDPVIANNSESIDDAVLFTEVKKEEKEVKMYSNTRQKAAPELLSTSESIVNQAPVPVVDQPPVTLDDEAKAKWMCSVCTEGKLGPCFVCGQDDADSEKLKCGYCNKAYHEACSNKWPQSQKSISAKGRVLYHCPQHVCHTCVSDNPKSIYAKFTNDRLVRCVKCPATYHYGNYCIPAGSQVLSVSQILCPRHYVPPKKSVYHVSASWCMLCSAGGALICCDLCPNSFHLSCVSLTEAPQGSFYCEDCETGRYPLYGEIVWVKLGTYRWWPARILFPQEIPVNINQLPHSFGEFAVEFFGSHDFYWVNRGRCFLYHEGDGSSQNVMKSRTDELFMKGVEESKLAFEKWNEERANREASSRPSMKPPKFQKIVTNKIVGNAGSKANQENDSEQVGQRCECGYDPDIIHPCGSQAECINRLLSVECDDDICSANERCCNRNFERRRYPRLVPFKTENRGWGLKTLDPIPKGAFIIEYVGEMIDEEEYRRRLEKMHRNKDENFYFLTIDKDRMLDAGPKGNVSRFMNHSCEPNCETQKWTVHGDTRIGLFSCDNIQPGTELVFNYNLTTQGNVKVECKCGSGKCSGYIGGKLKIKNNKQSKAQTPSGDDKKGPAKKKRRKSKAKHTEDTCFTCGNGGELLLCDDASCPKAYHLSCLGLTKHPAGGWVCPWHQCSVCSATNKIQRCTLCINSYCAEHAEGNISLNNKNRGLLCFSHNLSDSGSDWSDDRGLSDEEEDINKKSKKYSKTKIINGHID